jgi:hypothetical protein
MKRFRFFILLVLVLVVNLGFNACEDSAGYNTAGKNSAYLRIVNDTSSVQDVVVTVDGERYIVEIRPSKSILWGGGRGATFNVDRSGSFFWTGFIPRGEIVVLRLSQW